MSQFNLENITVYNTKAEEYEQNRKQVGRLFHLINFITIVFS